MATKKKSSTNNPEFDRSLVLAARSLGWLLPETEEEVAESEQEVELTDESAVLEPMDPFEALDREATFSRRPAR